MKNVRKIAGTGIALLTALCVMTLCVTACESPAGSNDRAVTGVSLNKTTLSVAVGGTETLNATVAPADAANKNVTWTSSDPAKATVSGSGVVTGVAEGTTTITVTTVDGGYTATCTITVTPPVDVTGVSLNKTTLSVYVGDTETLTATITPANATNKAVSWTSDNEGVATVSAAGVVKGVAEGTATITVTTADGGYTATCAVTVTIPSAGALSTRTLSGISVPFRYVPAGSFQRDGTAANVSIITGGYWMGETEVTQELFQAVMGTNPSSFTSGAAAGETQNWRPVENINWYHAIAFCNKLSIANGKEPVYSVSGVSDWAALAYNSIPASNSADWNAATWDKSTNGYRLPTEMEWMWAAMGADTAAQPNTTGRTKAFAGSTGSNSINDYAWYDTNSDSKTHEVGKKNANELELKDMSGNVFEWCWDWYDSYPAGERTDYDGAASGADRVFRGGSWYYSASYCAVSCRFSAYPDAGATYLGFRVVCP
ncbi:MAG: Ig-like domain-containing protein [Treponema sp.]|jgi:formylglycine-generating enzyme required for sulfatase activity|nr:Ig-like domain-containing protein [Treponema sp.]